MTRRSFRTVLRSHILAIAIAPLLLVVAFFAYNSTRSTLKQAHFSIAWQARNLAAEIKQELFVQSNLVARVAKTKSISHLPVEIIYTNIAQEALQSFLRDNPRYSAAMIIDADGYIIEAFPVQAQNIKSAAIRNIDRFSIDNARADSLATPFLITNDHHFDELGAAGGSQAFFGLAAPLMLKRDSFISPYQVTGTLLALMPMERLIDPWLKATAITDENFSLQLAFNESTVYSHTPVGESHTKTVSATASIDQYRNGKTELGNLSISIHMPEAAFLQDVRASLYVVAAGLSLLVVLVSLAARHISLKLSNPLNRVVDISHRFEKGNYADVDEDLEFTEFDTIKRSLGKMAGTIREQITSLTEEKLHATSSERLKSEFLANMSHEIRTPINGVIGMINLLAKTQLTDNQKHKLMLAKTSAESLLSIINDILDFSKIEADKVMLESLEFDLVNFLGDFAETMAVRAREKGLELILDVADIEQSPVVGDLGRLRQILSNIVGNAIKFTEQGEVFIKAALTPQDKEHLLFRCVVEDSGIGMGPEQLANLFQPFSQADASTTRQFGGTGLGLSISKRLCELMGGTISVTSEARRGSIFTVSISLRSSANTHLRSTPPWIRQRNVLVVDDNIRSAAAIARQLARWGANVVNTKSLQHVESHLLSTTSYDLLIIAKLIAGQSVMPWIKHLRSKAELAELKIIVMTHILESVSDQVLREHGVDFIFPKPLTYRDFLDAIDSTLNPQSASPLRSVRIIEVQREGFSLTMDNGRRHVLLVEDNNVNQEVVQGMLHELGISADIAVNGAEALKLLSQADNRDAYALVLMDCQMPVMDGFETTRQIRAGTCGPHNTLIPIIALTANAMQGDRERCLEVGMNDYLAKPLNGEALECALAQWMELPRRENAPSPAADFDNTTQAANNTSANQSSTGRQFDSRVWDQSAALHRVRDNEDRLKRLVQLFIEDVPERIAQLNEALRGHRLDQAQNLAHGIKGVAGNLSANKLMATAAEVEQFCRIHGAAEDGTLSRYAEKVARDANRTLEALRAFVA